MRFQYDASQNRHVEDDAGRLKRFVGGLYERQKAGSTVTHRHFVPTSAGVAGVYQVEEGGSVARRYLHQDHLGSAVLVTDDSGGSFEERKVAEYAYDAWGKPIDPATWGALGGWDHADSSDRGFTGHVPRPQADTRAPAKAMLDGVELVHMT